MLRSGRRKFLLAGGISPVGEQSCRSRRYTNITALAPHCDATTDVVNELIFFNAVLCPLRVEWKLLRAFLFRLGDRHEIRTCPPAVVDLVGDAFLGKSKMASRLVKRRIDDRVLNDNLAHTHTSKDCKALSPHPSPFFTIRNDRDQFPPLQYLSANTIRILRKSLF